MKEENTLICPICGEEFSWKNSGKPKLSYTNHLKFCTWRKLVLDYFELSLDKVETLLDKFGSVRNFLNNLPENLLVNPHSHWPYKLFKDLGIDTSCARANNSEIVKLSRENANLQKYGYKNSFCKNHPSRKKWEKRLLEEEGIVNVFLRETVKKKIVKTMLEKYGVEHAALSELFVVTEEYMIKKYGEEEGKAAWKKLCYERGKSMRLDYYIEKYGEEKGKKKYAEKLYNLSSYCSSKINKISSLNKKFKLLFDKLKIQYEEEFCIWLDDITPKFYDFKIGNTIIELNGDFWHANPDKYKENDILHFPGTDGVLAKDIWEKDRIKKELAEKQGFKVCYIWETQINKNFDKIKTFFENYANSKNQKNNKNSNN